MRADLIWGVPRFELHEKGKRGEEGKGGRDAFTRSKGLPDFRSGVEEREGESPLPLRHHEGRTSALLHWECEMMPK